MGKVGKNGVRFDYECILYVFNWEHSAFLIDPNNNSDIVNK